jgi:hypothetical protein
MMMGSVDEDGMRNKREQQATDQPQLSLTGHKGSGELFQSCALHGCQRDIACTACYVISTSGVNVPGPASGDGETTVNYKL